MFPARGYPMKFILAVLVFTASLAHAQKQGETFTYEIEIARSGDIDSGTDVQFEKRVIDVQFVGKQGWFSKKVIFAFAEKGQPIGQFIFENSRWTLALETWAFAVADATQCMQYQGSFLQGGAKVGNQLLNACQIRGTRDSLLVGYSIVNLPTPMQYELEERGKLMDAKPKVIPQATYLPPEIAAHLKLLTDDLGRYWYKAKLINHTGGESGTLRRYFTSSSSVSRQHLQ
jgi:hypothetical protein